MATTAVKNAPGQRHNYIPALTLDFRMVHDIPWNILHLLRLRLAAINHYVEAKITLQESGCYNNLESRIQFIIDMEICLAQVPEDYRQVLILRFGHCMGPHILARHLGVTEQTVNRWMLRGFQSLLRMRSFPLFSPEAIQVFSDTL